MSPFESDYDGVPEWNVDADPAEKYQRGRTSDAAYIRGELRRQMLEDYDRSFSGPTTVVWRQAGCGHWRKTTPHGMCHVCLENAKKVWPK